MEKRPSPSAGIPKGRPEAMFQSMKHRLVGGDPVLSAQTVRTNPARRHHRPSRWGALQKRYEDLDIGSYPAFRKRPSPAVLAGAARPTDDARLAKAPRFELMDHHPQDERRGRRSLPS